MTVVALDAMGGDFGPSVVVPAIDAFRKEFAGNSKFTDDTRFVLFGKDADIECELKKFPNVSPYVEVVHSDCIVTNTMKPLEALRHRADSNLGMAIQYVADGKADAVVSAANTGAYITLATVLLGTLESIDRPAIPACMPNAHGKSVVLDLGATLECSSKRLTQFALMGEALARVLLKKESPTVGLLNVGSEEMKGNPVVQETGRMLHLIQESVSNSQRQDIDPFVFYGFVEGDDIFKGTTDVVVTDGFSGNLTLKGIEGTVRFIFKLIKEAFGTSVWGRFKALIAMPFLCPVVSKVKQIMDPRLYNGAVFLGLKKIAVKSHGNADVFSFAQAIKVAVQTARSNFIDDVEKRLHLLTEIQ